MNETEIRQQERDRFAQYLRAIAPTKPTEVRQFCQWLAREVEGDRIKEAA